jgi:hypothetical protein
MPRRHMGKWSYSSMQLLSLQRKSHQYPLNRSLGGPQSQSGWCGEEKSLSMPQIEPRFSVLQPKQLL